MDPDPDPGSGSLPFSALTFKMPTKNKVHLHHFLKIETQKEVTKQKEARFYITSFA
jgi:hypothetical protein